MTARIRLFAIYVALMSVPAIAQQSGLTAETWTGLSPGKSILILQKEGISARAPNTMQTLPESKITGLPANSGTRLRGTITPLVDDTYTFWVNGTDNVALWLSEDGSRFTKRLIANHLGTTTTTEWNKHRDQKSMPIALNAGTTYHIEAHVMSSVNNGHLSIAWQGRKGNWALAANGATASQSTTQWSLNASNAIDGNTSGIWNQSTLTTNIQNSWFKVDFAETRPVNQVVLFNNSNDQLRLSNFRISALDASGGVLSQADFFTTSGNVGNSFTWDMPSVVEAKAIKIQLLGNNRAGNGYLALSEIQAFHVTPPPTNWALASNGSTASQSSISSSYLASLAIDGNTSGDLNAGSVTMTEDEANSWHQVDFGQNRPVNRIVLHNRNTLQSRLSNFRVSLLDASNVVLATRVYFPTSGNAGSLLYWNLVQTIQARSIRVELLGQNLDGNGHLSLAEIQAFEVNPLLEARNFQIIPAAYLGAVAPDPSDQSDNSLLDAWEQLTGLAASSLPGAQLEYGDPDKDGISNYEEQYLGSNPLAIESFGDVITRSMWMNLSGNGSEGVVSMTHFANRQRFLSYPNDESLVAGIDASTGYIEYGARYRGTFIAPATGAYRFWLAGSGDAQLWMSDGTVKDPESNQPLTNRFGKQLLATSGHVTPQRDFDYTANQRSRSIILQQGQSYYIEVLHKVAQGSLDHVSVAWQPPGQTRAIIPASAFLANAPEPADNDDDGLSDAWESAKGLNPADNGLNSSGEGEYGDPDADKICNLEEYQLGTNPLLSDSDGDGVNDYDEIKLYGSDPNESNELATAALDLPDLSQFSAGGWSPDELGALISWERRGAITYTFDVPNAGVHEVEVRAGAISTTEWITKSMPVSLTLDGHTEPFVSKVLLSANGNADTIRATTPWLSVGTHTITIYHHNVSSNLRLRLDTIIIKCLGGLDLDENGIPDWIEEKAALENTLTRIPTSSLTSPVSIEGITSYLPSTTLTVQDEHGSTSVTPVASINNSFYADVPLSANGEVVLNASYQGGIIQKSHTISWAATNLLDSFANNTLHIRLGDSLRLTAYDPAEEASGSFILAGSSSLQSLLPSGSQQSIGPVPITFTSPGTHTISASWTPESGPSRTATVNIVVNAANFGASHLVPVGTPRNWTLSNLAASHEVEADSRVIFTEISTTTPRVFKVSTSQASNRHVVARLPAHVDGAPSAILARGTIHGFSVAHVDQTGDAQIINRYMDGTYVMQSSIVAQNLPDNVVIRITLSNQGSLFTNGSNVIELRASDFDANGIARISYEYSGPTAPKLCHNAQLIYLP